MDNETNPGEIIKIMSSKNGTLGRINGELPEMAEKKAQADRDYKVARAKKIMELKAEKMPVTLILKVVDGDKLVSELEFKSKVQDEMYRIKLESLKDTRIAIDTCRSLLTWKREEYKNINIEG